MSATNQQMLEHTLEYLNQMYPISGDRPDIVAIKIAELEDQLRSFDNDQIYDSVSEPEPYHDIIIGRIIRFLYTQTRPITDTVLMNIVGYTGTDIQFKNLIRCGQSLHAIYGKIWITRNGTILLNPKIRNYIRDNL